MPLQLTAAGWLRRGPLWVLQCMQRHFYSQQPHTRESVCVSPTRVQGHVRALIAIGPELPVSGPEPSRERSMVCAGWWHSAVPPPHSQ